MDNNYLIYFFLILFFTNFSILNLLFGFIVNLMLIKLYNNSKQGALLEEYTIYLKENGQIIRRTATRNYTSTDYIDSTTSTPMDIGYALK